MTMRIETERLILRRPEAADETVFLAYTASDRYRAERGQKSVTEQWSYFTSLLGHWQVRGYGRFLVTEKASGKTLGHIGPLFPAGWPEREIAWHLWTDAAEGRGLAREAAAACITHAYRDLGWDSAVSYIAPDNSRSRALAERLGAVIDPDAAPSPNFTDTPPLVYRHPRPNIEATS